ncbi:MAG: hypothetical protein PWR13_968 [Archaeoglobi archaeon]|nr:hypothetical protein [Archaeoglobi archaeon]
MILLYVECHPDTVLVRTLGIPRREIRHVHSKGNVCNRLSKSENSKGLLDEDPYSSQPNYLKKLRLVDERDDLKLLMDNRNSNKVIVVCPTLEGWIIATSKEAGINLRDFSLPDDPHGLHKIINLNLDKFEALVKELLGKSQRMDTLKRFLTEGY